VIAVAAHALLLIAAVLTPLVMFDDVLPAADHAVRAFFTSPPDVAPPPPPPPPPPAASVRPRVRTAPAPPPDPGRFVAPIAVPERVVPDEGIDLGVEGGVPGGVEGGVPGGILGGVVGGLPTEAPPPPPQIVRVGGKINAPKLVHEVKPVFPELARAARFSGLVILEAQVGVDGRVKSLKVLRSVPIFDDAAVEAVTQWRYQPLLLNGQPTEFIVTITVQFNLVRALSGGGNP